MSATVPKNGKPRQLDKAAEPAEQVTVEQIKDPPALSRIVMRLLRDVAVLKRRFWPQHVDFEDQAFDATGVTKYKFPHGFAGRVRWWPIDVTIAAAAPCLVQHSSTDKNTLVLISRAAATASIRIEEAG